VDTHFAEKARDGRGHEAIREIPDKRVIPADVRAS